MDLPRDLPGTPYRLVRALGRGGMGCVFEAVHMGLGRSVAIKMLPEERETDAHAIDRMRVEAQALAKVSHPSIVGVFDVGRTTGGAAFVVMELVRGETLHARLKKGRLSIRDGIRIVRCVAEGLHAAHAAGFVHRDVKPSNVVVEDDGHAKLLDFGIAKVISKSAGVAPPIHGTAEGIPVGTPFYFSPEQARGERVDARSDVYSCGAMLWLVLCGKRLFGEACDLIGLVHAHCTTEARPPSENGMEAPAIVRALIDAATLRALQKEPADRFESAAELAAALRAIEEALDAEERRTAVEEERRAAPAAAPPARVRKRLPRKKGLSHVGFVVLVCAVSALLAVVTIVVLELVGRGSGVRPSLKAKVSAAP